MIGTVLAVLAVAGAVYALLWEEGQQRIEAELHARHLAAMRQIAIHAERMQPAFANLGISVKQATENFRAFSRAFQKDLPE